MTERDERWEDVFAYIGPVRDYLRIQSEEETKDFSEIVFEVPYGDTLWWSRHIIHNDDLADFKADRPILNWLLDKMVDVIDDYIEGRRT